MTLQATTSGDLLAVGGELAGHADCCVAVEPCCCVGLPDTTLLLSLTELNITSSTCDVNCAAPWTIVNEPANASGPRSGATWSIICEDADERMWGVIALVCTDGIYSLSLSLLGFPQIRSSCVSPVTVYCAVDLSGELGFPSECDPFLIDVTIPITLRTSVLGSNCGTGTIRVTITE
jgi:hypothetical protein